MYTHLLMHAHSVVMSTLVINLPFVFARTSISINIMRKTTHIHMYIFTRIDAHNAVAFIGSATTRFRENANFARECTHNWNVSLAWITTLLLLLLLLLHMSQRWAGNSVKLFYCIALWCCWVSYRVYHIYLYISLWILNFIINLKKPPFFLHTLHLIWTSLELVVFVAFKWTAAITEWVGWLI